MVLSSGALSLSLSHSLFVSLLPAAAASSALSWGFFVLRPNGSSPFVANALIPFVLLACFVAACVCECVCVCD